MRIDVDNSVAYRRKVSEAQRDLTQEDLADLKKLHAFHVEQKRNLRKAQQHELAMMRLQHQQATDAQQRELTAASERLAAIRAQGREESAQLTAIQEQLKDNYIRQHHETAAHHEALQRKVQTAFQEKSRQLLNKAFAEQDELKARTNIQLIREQYRHQRELAQQAAAHEAALRSQTNEHDRALYQENEDFQKFFQAMQKAHFEQLEHQRQLNEDRTRKYAANFEEQNEQRKDYYAQRRLGLEQALQDNFQRHRDAVNTALAQAREKMEQEVVALQQQASYVKQDVANKLQDSFYHFEKLPATLTETPNGAILSIKVPPHEKNNVFLHIHGRELRLGFSRRIEQSLADTGGMGRYARSESLSQEFRTQKIMDPRSLKQTYENGVLTFALQNA